MLEAAENVECGMMKAFRSVSLFTTHYSKFTIQSATHLAALTRILR